MHPAAGAEEESLAARRKRLMKKEASARHRERKGLTRAGADWADLPHDILIRIFILAAESPSSSSHDTNNNARASSSTSSSSLRVVGALPLIPRLTRVCRGWRDAVSADPAPLWRHVDISYGWCRASDAIVAKLCKDGRWSQLEHLNMSAGCAPLSIHTQQRVFDSLNLRLNRGVYALYAVSYWLARGLKTEQTCRGAQP